MAESALSLPQRRQFLQVPGRPQASPGAAEQAVRRLTARFAVVLRVTCTVVAAVVAVLVVGGPSGGAGAGGAPPWPWVIGAQAAMVLAAALLAAVLLRDPGARWVVAVDVLVATAVCVLQGMLLPAGLVAQGASWVAAVASITVVVADLTLDTWLAVAASLVVMGGWSVGSTLGAHRSTGGATELGAGFAAGTAHLVTLFVQAAVTSTMMIMMVRAARAADAALAEQARVDTAAAVEAAKRLDERMLRRRLHDTVLATLTMVGSGVIGAGSRTLRARAAGDLKVLAELGSVARPRGGPQRLDERLRQLTDRIRPLLEVRTDLADCEVPEEVAEAMAGAAHEALVNIAKHAEVETARLSLRSGAGGVVVEVVDAGVGFDPARTGRHHLGLRESIKGRLGDVGGQATVVSAPGFGCTVTLGWPGA